MTQTDVMNAVAQLKKTRHGMTALRAIYVFLDGGGATLDVQNQEAAIKLLAATWGSHAGTALDAMRGALSIGDRV